MEQHKHGEHNVSVDETSTPRLIEKARNGSREAFDQIAARFMPRLRQVTRAMLSTESSLNFEPDDLLQETLLGAWRDIRSFRWLNETAFWFWLKAIARHRIQSAIRKIRAKKRAHREVSLTPAKGQDADGEHAETALASGCPTPSGVIRRDERFDRLQLAMGRLNPEQRRIVFLTQLCGVSVTDVARRMGRSRPAVSMALLRALRQIKSTFGATDSLHLADRNLAYEAGVVA